jgi:hypothetical protein
MEKRESTGRREKGRIGREGEEGRGRERKGNGRLGEETMDDGQILSGMPIVLEITIVLLEPNRMPSTQRRDGAARLLWMVVYRSPTALLRHQMELPGLSLYVPEYGMDNTGVLLQYMFECTRTHASVSMVFEPRHTICDSSLVNNLITHSHRICAD